MAYSEQVGVNLQVGVPFKGEINLLYSFMGKMTHLPGKPASAAKAALNLLLLTGSLTCLLRRCRTPANDHICSLKAVAQVTFYLLHLHDRGVFSQRYYNEVTLLEHTFTAYLSECLSRYSLSSVSLHGASDLFRG